MALGRFARGGTLESCREILLLTSFPEEELIMKAADSITVVVILIALSCAVQAFVTYLE